MTITRPWANTKIRLMNFWLIRTSSNNIMQWTKQHWKETCTVHDAWKTRVARYLISCGVACDWFIACVANFLVVHVRSTRNRSAYERSVPGFLGRAKNWGGGKKQRKRREIFARPRSDRKKGPHPARSVRTLATRLEHLARTFLTNHGSLEIREKNHLT